MSVGLQVKAANINLVLAWQCNLQGNAKAITYNNNNNIAIGAAVTDFSWPGRLLQSSAQDFILPTPLQPCGGGDAVIPVFPGLSHGLRTHSYTPAVATDLSCSPCSPPDGDPCPF